jgi:hypothetical protein
MYIVYSCVILALKKLFEGTLIYGDCKTLLELINQESSVVKKTSKKVYPLPQATKKVTVHLEGEILDPKCYFEIMKPGEGKIHKAVKSGASAKVFRLYSGPMRAVRKTYPTAII